MKETLLSVLGLGHRFPDGSYAFRDVSLSIAAGEFILLTGRNGSGKSVFLQHLNALRTPCEGSILYRSRPAHDDIGLLRGRVGYVFQNADTQIIGASVLDDVRFGPLNAGLSRAASDERAAAACAACSLSGFESRASHTLSGGEKRRLAIAGVLAMDPEIIIFDEPFENLDYEGVVLVLSIMRSLHEAGRTIITVTHDLEKCAAHATRIIAFEKGRLVLDAKPAAALKTIHRYGLKKHDPRRLKEMTWL